MGDTDKRHWIPTDLPGETIAAAAPLDGIQILSARGSTRCWKEVHQHFSLALVAPNQPGVAAKWRTRGRSLVTRDGGFMAIEPGDIHVTQAVSAPAAFDLVRFDETLVADALQGLDRGGTFHFREPSAEDPLVARAMRLFVDAHSSGEHPFVVEAALAELLGTVVTQLGEDPLTSVVPRRSAVRDYRLRRALDYLRESLDDRPSLEELAKELGMSRFRLCAAFKAAYGVTIVQYWTTWRIYAASQRLLKGVPIRQVSADLGFHDEAFFTRVFKRHKGCPPGAWVALNQRNRLGSR